MYSLGNMTLDSQWLNYRDSILEMQSHGELLDALESTNSQHILYYSANFRSCKGVSTLYPCTLHGRKSWGPTPIPSPSPWWPKESYIEKYLGFHGWPLKKSEGRPQRCIRIKDLCYAVYAKLNNKHFSFSLGHCNSISTKCTHKCKIFHRCVVSVLACSGRRIHHECSDTDIDSHHQTPDIHQHLKETN